MKASIGGSQRKPPTGSPLGVMPAEFVCAGNLSQSRAVAVWASDHLRPVVRSEVMPPVVESWHGILEVGSRW